jgi:hypothetical protein
MADQEEPRQERTDGRPDDAEAMARLQEEINSLPVSEHVVYMVQSLSALAVGRLGLAPDATDRRDLDQARLAIDAIKALLVVLEQVRPAGEITALRGMLSQLQLAYAGAIAGGKAGRPVAVPEESGPPQAGDTPSGGEEAPFVSKEPPATPKKAAAQEKPATPKKRATPKKPDTAAKKPGAAPKKAPKPGGGSQGGS